MKASIRGTQIYFDIAGMQLSPKGKDFEERPVLFMLHGGPGGDHLRFKQHSLDLQSVAQLIFIDHRGCGRSKKTQAKDYTLHNNIEDIEALRKYLGLERICILGTSYGGIVAQGYAIKYSQHIDKLVLVVTAPSYRFLDEAQQTLTARGNAKQIAISKNLWEGKFKSHRHIMAYFQQMDPLYSRAYKKKPKKAVKIKTIWSHEAINQAFGGFLKRFDYTKKLKKITCPTLILAGQDDWICSPAQSKIIAQHVPHSTLKIFKNCGHSIAIDAHKKYIRAISNFLKI